MLSAPYSDKSLIRNALAYRTARRMGRYAPRTRFVELRLNGNYRGVYVLTEKIKLGDGRVEEYENGFLLEMTFNSQEVGEDFFRVPATGRPIIWTDPERDDLSRRERRRVKRQVKRFERSLYRRPRRIARRMDLDAAIDFTLVQELFKNQDAFHGSHYFHRGEDGRIVLGPVWDFDLSAGNSLQSPSDRVPGSMTRNRDWAKQLWSTARFRHRIADRWSALRRDGLRRKLLRDIRGMQRQLGGGPAAATSTAGRSSAATCGRTRSTRPRAATGRAGTPRWRSCGRSSSSASGGWTATCADRPRARVVSHGQTRRAAPWRFEVKLAHVARAQSIAWGSCGIDVRGS